MRISDWSSDVCSSDLNDPKRILPPIKHEPTSQTGLTHDDGALSMARYAPGSATGDFFIVLGKMPGMDAHPEAPGDNQGFAVFAHVVEGLDAVKTILAAPKSPTAGEGVMKGQMLEEPRSESVVSGKSVQ